MPSGERIELLFLGVNDVGFRVYEWLCDRDDADVVALVTTPEQLALVHEREPDMIVSVGFDHLVPEEVLAIPPRGCVNLHPGYLPYNRGKSPNVWSIVDGTPAGATLHYMDPEFDTGDMIARQRVETDFADTGKDLHRRLERAQFDLFTGTWPDLVADDVETTPQDPDAGTYHRQSAFEDLREIDPDETVEAKAFLNRLRALTFPPFDNAYLDVDGERYYVDVNVRSRSETTGDDPDGLLSSY